MNKTILKIMNSLGLFMLFASCSTPLPKLHPEYVGTDTRVQPLVNEFMWLSKQNHLDFYNKVTIGFKDINQGNAIGMCTYGIMWREIDIDTEYWNHSTNATHLALVFHELSHCYCGRSHDYGENLNYPETESARLARAIRWTLEGGPRPGYWDDGCPTSLMYPEVVTNDCVNAHYSEYTKEMFDRCQPW